MSRVRSFAVAFNYLILAYLRLNYLRLIIIRPVLTSLFDRNFIILSTWLYNYSSNGDMQPSTVILGQ